MSYDAKFKGKFEYKDKEALLRALVIIKEEQTNPHADEPSGIYEQDFELEKDGIVLSINDISSMSASYWYGSYRVICKISKEAIKGKIKCSFEGDPDRVVKAGQGY